MKVLPLRVPTAAVAMMGIRAQAKKELRQDKPALYERLSTPRPTLLDRLTNPSLEEEQSQCETSNYLD